MECIENKNPENDFGETPLHLAAQEGHLDIFKHIVKPVTDKNPTNYFSETQFHFCFGQ